MSRAVFVVIVVWWTLVVGGGCEGGLHSTSRVWLDDQGAYRDVVIHIHPDFLPNNCSTFFANLKAALGSFSSDLWSATNGRVYLGEVRVVVPEGVRRACGGAVPGNPSTTTTTTTTTATWHRWSTADFRVVPGGGDSGGWAWGPEGSMGVGVEQVKGCGRPGQHITIDAGVLQDLHPAELHTLGRSLVGGWARYRWGVFEERGYESHPRYPSAHLFDESLAPTSCTPAPTLGHWRHKDGRGECGDDPEGDVDKCVWVPETAAQVNTSLLYRADLPQISGFCDSSTHDPDSPTPHNLLCEARSVWDVMKEHPDFTTHHPHTHSMPHYVHPTHNSPHSTRPSPHATQSSNPNSSLDSTRPSLQASQPSQQSTHKVPQATHSSPPSTHSSPQSTHSSSTSTHSSPQSTHSSPPSTHPSLLSTHPFPQSTHSSPRSTHSSPHSTHPFPNSTSENGELPPHMTHPSSPHSFHSDTAHLSSSPHPTRTSVRGSEERSGNVVDRVTIRAESFSSAETTTEAHNITSVYFSEQLNNSDAAFSTDRIFLDDVRRKIIGKSASQERKSHPFTTHQPPKQESESTAVRKKRSEARNFRSGSAEALMRPSLVTAHIVKSSPPPSLEKTREIAKPNFTASDDTDPKNEETTDRLFDEWSDEIDMRDPEDLLPSLEKNKGASPNPRPPPPPEVIFMAPAPSVVVLALDLSDTAISQVDLEAVRGGVLRWLWGLGGGVRVGVVAAYHNASYPLTLGPLLPPAPTTAARLEDELALLPSRAEVQAGVYGGEYCLDCVLEEAAKMLEGGGVMAGTGVLLLAACNPPVTPGHLSHPALTSLSALHTLALCPTATPLFDQLAGNNGAWVLPGPQSPAGTDGGEVSSEQRAAKVLTAATQATLASPVQPTLIMVGRWVNGGGSSEVSSNGPYSTVSGKIMLPLAPHPLLLVVTMDHHAKVVEVRDPSGAEVDLKRDTNQRFWMVVPAGSGGQYTYTTKFLTTSVHFPLSVVLEVYERRSPDPGIQVTLQTNTAGHLPLEPGSPPLVVWARVTLGGRPVVGARVMLTVTHLSHDGPTHMMVELLDNGSAEPDVRAQDGVYTRYVTWLPGEGRYAITASATDHQGAASVLTRRRRDGHLVPVSAGQFHERSGSVAVTVSRVTSADMVPPSRVTDLSVIHLHNTTVNLTWSAPGGDLDQGSAWRYELKMYTERGALSEERFNTSTIAVYCIAHDLRAPTETPAPHGSPQNCLTDLPFTNLRWYFAIRAVDAANNTGRISNVVSAFVPDPPTVPQPTVAGDGSSSIQTVLMSTVASKHPGDLRDNNTTTSSRPYDWRVWVAVGVAVGGIVVAGFVMLMCVCCCRRGRGNGRTEKEPDRPIYKIYVNNAYIQEEDGEIKVVSNGKLVDEKEPSQVQEWVNSLSKFESGDNVDPTTTTDAPLVECRPRASVKYASPVRFGVLTNGSIMRDNCPSASSTSSSKPSEDQSGEDLKYRELSETTSNSTTDGGASATSTATTDTVPPPLPNMTRAVPVNVQPSNSDLPPPPPPSQLMPQPLGIPGPTVISIHSGPTLNTGYSSDEEGGFRPRQVLGGPPGPRRYLPTQFSSFRYLPPPPEYRSAMAGGSTGAGDIGIPVDYPTCHTISRATPITLPHGTVRSVKKRRHISFV